MTAQEIADIADALMEAQARVSTLAPITDTRPGFDVADAYAVLALIESRRIAAGWLPAGRKIGFTNRTIWPRYGVYQPMWARVWRQTVHHARDGRARLEIAGFVQPRIEPEVVFGMAGPAPASEDAAEILASVEWIAAGFEVVQSHFPGWKFKAPDCTAAFGLHAALVVGTPVRVTPAMRGTLAAALPAFVLTLRKNGQVLEKGVGANVLGSPALALAHLARLLATQPTAPPLVAGEIVTTGTVTDAWPGKAGEVFASDYGALGIPGLELELA